jgi:hyperosmotically inducible protein
MDARQNAIATMLTAVFLAAGATGCAVSDTTRSAGTTIDDSALTAKVKTQLVAADDIPWNDINVQSYRGVVSLSGFVDNSSQKQRAEQAARSVTGVRVVENHLEVKPATPR